jgi:hypothetical protein
VDGVLRKLQLKDRTPVLLLGLPEELEPLEATIPGRVDTMPSGSYPFVLAFAHSLAELRTIAGVLDVSAEDDAVCWIAYPKGSSKRYPAADLNRDSTHARLGDLGWDGVSLVALDADWSALRFKRA